MVYDKPSGLMIQWEKEMFLGKLILIVIVLDVSI